MSSEAKTPQHAPHAGGPERATTETVDAVQSTARDASRVVVAVYVDERGRSATHRISGLVDAPELVEAHGRTWRRVRYIGRIHRRTAA